ncbi:MAG: tetratricopeptide repeat protein, partial [Microcoleaceae cyanobacterium]
MKNNFKAEAQLLFKKLEINLDEVPFEQIDHYTSVKYFLTIEDEPSSESSNLEKVGRYLESFHHLCEVEDWERAGELIFTELKTSTQDSFVNQIGTWGYYQQQIDLYIKLLNKFPSDVDILFLLGLANAYSETGKYRTGIAYYQKGLAIAQSQKDRSVEGKILGGLGLCHHYLGEAQQAIQLQEKSLELARLVS